MAVSRTVPLVSHHLRNNVSTASELSTRPSTLNGELHEQSRRFNCRWSAYRGHVGSREHRHRARFRQISHTLKHSALSSQRFILRCCLPIQRVVTPCLAGVSAVDRRESGPTSSKYPETPHTDGTQNAVAFTESRGVHAPDSIRFQCDNGVLLGGGMNANLSPTSLRAFRGQASAPPHCTLDQLQRQNNSPCDAVCSCARVLPYAAAAARTRCLYASAALPRRHELCTALSRAQPPPGARYGSVLEWECSYSPPHELPEPPPRGSNICPTGMRGQRESTRPSASLPWTSLTTDPGQLRMTRGPCSPGHGTLWTSRCWMGPRSAPTYPRTPYTYVCLQLNYLHLHLHYTQRRRRRACGGRLHVSAQLQTPKLPSSWWPGAHMSPVAL